MSLSARITSNPGLTGHLTPPKQDSGNATVQATTKCRGSRYRSIFSLSTSSAACVQKNVNTWWSEAAEASKQNTEEVNKNSLRPGWGKMFGKRSTPPIFGGSLFCNGLPEANDPHLDLSENRVPPNKWCLKSVKWSFSPFKNDHVLKNHCPHLEEAMVFRIKTFVIWVWVKIRYPKIMDG